MDHIQPLKYALVPLGVPQTVLRLRSDRVSPGPAGRVLGVAEDIIGATYGCHGGTPLLRVVGRVVAGLVVEDLGFVQDHIHPAEQGLTLLDVPEGPASAERE